MPEGPEIRRAADEIADILEGQNIEAVRFGMPRLRHYSRQLRGHRVSNIETRGKALLTHFEHGYSIYSHNQLYGVWPTGELDTHPFLAKIEPDIMDPGLTWQAVVARLHPGARPAALSTGEPGRLARSTLAISRRLYDCPGCQPD